MFKILFLGANPAKTTQLALAKELQAIKQRIRNAGAGARIRVEQEWAVKLDDLNAALLRHKPHIVHFGGHGNAAGELVFETEHGGPATAKPEALTNLFKILQRNIRCVVLNACFSVSQAKAIAVHIECVVGMTGAINDESAIAFAWAFYEALALGASVQEAFDLGRNTVDMSRLPGKDAPKLITRTDVKPENLRLTHKRASPAGPLHVVQTNIHSASASPPVPPPSPSESTAARSTEPARHEQRHTGILGSRSVSLADMQSRLDICVRDKFLQSFVPRDLLPPTLKDYAELFDLVSTRTFPEGDLFDEVPALLHKSAPPIPLRVQGPPGSGKSLLLGILYQHLVTLRQRSSAAAVPFYVDTSVYQARVYPGDPATYERAARDACVNDLGVLAEAISLFPDDVFAVLIDGVDDRGKFYHLALEEVQRICRAGKHVKLIEGARTNSEAAADFSKTPSANAVTLRGLPVGSSSLASAVDAFVRATHLEMTNAAEYVNGRCVELGLLSVDIRTIAVLIQRRNAPAYAGARSVAQLNRLLCQDALHSGTAVDFESAIAEAAELAFESMIRRKSIPAQRILGNPSWGLLSVHATTTDFLVAEHFIRQLEAFAGGRDLDEDVLGFVFPAAITRYCKELINDAPRLQRAVIQALRRLGGKPKYKERTVLSYLCGRIKDRAERDEGRRLLNAHRREARMLMKNKEFQTMEPEVRKDMLLWSRTMVISLAALDDANAAREYVREMMQDPEADEVNRGFHLEYYGDIAYDPSSPSSLANRDRLESWQRTFDELTGRLRADLAAPKHRLFDIELYTVCSLAQKRHAQGCLDMGMRMGIIELLSAVPDERVEDTALRTYVHMVKDHLCEARFSIGHLILQLNGVKKNKRAGWVKRGFSDPESIADHMYGAYLLALLYLPELDSDEKRYSKRVILDMLLAHDVGEAFTGDIPSGDKTGAHRATEAAWMAYLSAASTYSGIGNLARVRELYEEFERGQSINAMIAKEMDKLENLVQLYVYQREGQIAPDFQVWRGGLIACVDTRQGRQVLRVIEAYFGGAGGAGAPQSAKKSPLRGAD